MTSGRSIVLLSGPEDDSPSEAMMRFRLYYEGLLRPTQGEPRGEQRNPLAPLKHEIRQKFHAQLKQLWATNKFLSEQKLSRTHPSIYRPRIYDPSSLGFANNEQVAARASEAPMAEVIADRYHEFGYRFVPLVRGEFSLLCALHILFLRRDGPGSVIQAGDIDNRIKTLIDALRKPQNALEMAGQSPQDGEDPFYVLMEDDKQVSHLEVETDILLDPLTNAQTDAHKVRLIITVELRPYDITMLNLSFVHP